MLELDGVVVGGGDDLAVVDGEGDKEDIMGVLDEAIGVGASVEVPKMELAVLGAKEGRTCHQRGGPHSR